LSAILVSGIDLCHTVDSCSHELQVGAILRSPRSTHIMKSFITLSFIWMLAGALQAEDSVRQLIIGVGGEIVLGNAVPGSINITGDGAFPIIEDNRGTIVAAASEVERGRAVGFTHGAFLKSVDLYAQPAAARAVKNAIRWVGRSSTPIVGVHPKLESLSVILQEAGFETQVFAVDELEEHDVAVYCVVANDLAEEVNMVRLFEFINDGGGVVTATTPWAFKKKFPDFSKFPGNRVLAATGIQYNPDGYMAKGPIQLTAIPEAVASLKGTQLALTPMGITDSESAARALAAADKDQSTEVREALIAKMREAKGLKGAALESFLIVLRDLNKAVGPIIPTKKSPVVPGVDPLVDAIIELETFFNENTPAGVMYAIPAASDYPGQVSEDAERISKTFMMDGTYHGWLEGRLAGGWAAKEMRPTGIYAAPGEVIRVTLPAKVAREGFEVVIGSYNGGLKNRDEWHRYPDWQVKVPVNSSTTEASSGLGGIVTIRVPREAKYDQLEVTIEGGVAAPVYIHGETDLEKWRSEIRNYPGPWAELASDRMIVTIPSDYIRGLSDPDALMEVWNGIIDTSAILVGVDRNHYRAERIVFDRQTAAGFMHSSYPVAAHLDGTAELAVDAKRLMDEGSWGFFHEYGHNHQHNLWALPRTVETTCNLWSVYVYEEFIGTNRNETHRAMRPLDRRQRINAYFAGGPDFEEWGVWTALETYLMVQEEFGWEPFTKVFVEYNQLEKEEWPKGQQEINDQWVIRLSKACGMNLKPFWSTWGLPLSRSVSEELKTLPVWEAHPVARFAKSEF